jgi:hypothetical protein
MLMQTQIANIDANVLIYKHRLALVLILLTSSIVIADSTLKLDLPDEFYLQSTDTKFSRDSQTYHTDKEEPKWRKPASASSPTVRWGANKSIYEENNQLDPMLSTQSPDKGAESINLTPQFEMRF